MGNKKRDHLAREQQAMKLRPREKRALIPIFVGAIVVAVSMTTMGADTTGINSTRGRMAAQFHAWITLDGRPVPSVTALIGIAIAVWGVRVANQAYASRPLDEKL